MAELLGAIASGVTLAVLFKACIEAFDLIQISRHQEVDFKKLKLRLNIEKCRLYIWGESMGLTDTTNADEDRPIDRFRFPEVVREILDVVLQLFYDSQKIRDKYGCRQATSEDLLLQDIDQNGPVRSLAASFSNFSIQSSQRLRTLKIIQNVFWVIHDRKKFVALIAEIKDLVDSLQGITSPSVPVARQAGTMRRKIASIRDAETLSLIAEVCSEDHPDIADAASTKADTLSLSSTHNRRMVAWTESVEEVDVETGERKSPDLESLTVTELKHKILGMIQEKKEREASSFPAPEPLAASPLVELSVASPSTPESAMKDSNIVPPSYVSQTTEQFSPAWTKAGPANMHEHTGHPNLLNQPYLLYPPYPAPSFSQSPDVSWGMIALSQQAPRNSNATQTPGAQADSYFFPTASSVSSYSASSNATQTPGAQADSYFFPTASSVSSYSASSNPSYLYHARSTSESVDEPIDSSSVTSDALLDYDRHHILGRPLSFQGASRSPAPQSIQTPFAQADSYFFPTASSVSSYSASSNATQTPGAQADSYFFPTASSVSSYSAPSNPGYPYHARSTSESVDEPIDGSSVTLDALLDYDKYHILRRPLLSFQYASRSPAPQPMMELFQSKASSTPKKYKCKDCDKRFASPISLQIHTYRHTSEKTFACEVKGCGRHFSTEGNLRRHRKMHKREDKREDKGNELDSRMET